MTILTIIDFTLRIIGRLIESGPPIQGMMGATLEIQRSQQMEAIEQQLYRQQARMAIGGMQRMAAGGGGGGAVAAAPGRAPAGQGFAERLVDDQPGMEGIFARINRMGGGGAGQDVGPPAPPPAPSEESISMLTDMGKKLKCLHNVNKH